MYEVYAYWNVAELEAMFNAVASIMGSGDYLGLLRTMAIVGIIVVVIATLTGRERLDGMWKWLFFLAIFQSMLLIPKVTVTIVDRTGNEPPRAVANVPIGLGAFAHSMSKVGDWLTGAFETVFSLPDDVKFRRNGTLFGHRVLSERLAVKSGNPSSDQQPAGVLPGVRRAGSGHRLHPHERGHPGGQQRLGQPEREDKPCATGDFARHDGPDHHEYGRLRCGVSEPHYPDQCGIEPPDHFAGFSPLPENESGRCRDGDCRLPGYLDQLSPGGFGLGTGCSQAGHRRQLS
jgi:hypothetical protein